eukprot:TRINITY_DN3602_c2_g1_i1.p1 TRINITY_DN3602_c2_g1~~TRINITY_DN3602_c2_g1_i1.p1  ORF type:complete len:357 (-),score=35.86 TRINITY_DN3602_c2_g1_i1:66-1091(-)
METLRIIALAEPSFLGQVGAGVVHMMIWTWISSWEFGLMKIVHRSMERLERVWNEVFPKNYAGDPGLETLQCEDSPGIIWVCNCLTMVHHGFAGGLMLAGYMTGWSSLWRHGMLTQLAGMDVLDITKMIYCVVLPPGPYPISHAIQSKPYIAMILFHHTVSILVGLPVNLYFSHLPQFQWFGVVITGGPLLFLVPDLLSRLVLASFPAQAAVDIFTFLCWTYQRLVFYFPHTYVLLKIVGQSPVLPWAMKAGFLVGAFNLSVFNLLIFACLVASLLKKLKANEPRRVPASNIMNLGGVALEMFPERRVDRRSSMPNLAKPLLLSVNATDGKSMLKFKSDRF